MPERAHPDRAPEAFICYSRADPEDAERLYQQLLCRYGISCWMDHRGIPAASDFESTIREAIRSSSSFLLLFGKNGLSGYQRDVELAAARERARETNGQFKIIPVLTSGANPADVLKEGVEAALQYADYRTPESSTDALWAIATAIRPTDKSALLFLARQNSLKKLSYNPSELTRWACGRVSRPLTEREWAEFVGNGKYVNACRN